MITLQISQRTSTNRYLRKIILFRFAEAKKRDDMSEKNQRFIFFAYISSRIL